MSAAGAAGSRGRGAVSRAPPELGAEPGARDSEATPSQEAAGESELLSQGRLSRRRGQLTNFTMVGPAERLH